MAKILTETDEEYFGTAAQRDAAKRSSWLWRLVREDPRFHSHGRGIGINFEERGIDIGLHAALARLQGAAGCGAVPASIVQNPRDELKALGLQSISLPMWQSSSSSLKAARLIVAEQTLPFDLKVVIIDEKTPNALMSDLSTMTECCGIALHNGAFIRGKDRPAVFMMACDAKNKPVGHAAAVAAYAPDSVNHAHAFWGMLATAMHRRGEGIARLLGAMSMLEMNKRHGFESFITGIESGNTPLESLSTRLGLVRNGKCVVIALDPSAFAKNSTIKIPHADRAES
jgi:hypothetical protein